MTVGAAGAHLGAVGGEPTHFEAFAHAHLGEQLAEEEDALSAESGDLDFEGVEVVLVRCRRRLSLARRLTLLMWVGLCSMRGRRSREFRGRCDAGPAFCTRIVYVVVENVEREVGDHCLGDPLAGLDGILGPDGGARRKDFDEGEAYAVTLDFERFADGLARLHDVLVVGEGDALDIDGSFEGGDQLADVQREAFVDGAATEGGLVVLSGRQAWWGPSGRRSCRRWRC